MLWHYEITHGKSATNGRIETTDLNVADVNQILNAIASKGGYIGVQLPDGMLLQVQREADGRLYIELLKSHTLQGQASYFNLPLAEQLFRKVQEMAGIDIEHEIRNLDLPWKEVDLRDR